MEERDNKIISDTISVKDIEDHIDACDVLGLGYIIKGDPSYEGWVDFTVVHPAPAGKPEKAGNVETVFGMSNVEIALDGDPFVTAKIIVDKESE